MSLIARLGLDSSGFATGLSKVKVAAAKAGEEIGSHMKGAFMAAFGTAALEETIRSTIEYGSRIGDLSKRTFISKEALQEFDYAARQTGATLDDFVGAETKLARAQGMALDGTKEAADAFARFGITVEDLKRLNPHQLFMLIASGIKESELSGRLMADSMTLLGRNATNLFGAFKEGLGELAETAHKVGAVLQDDIIDKLKNADDRMTDAKMRFRPIAANMSLWAVERLEDIGAVGAGFSEVGRSFKEHPFKTIFDSSAFSRGVDAYNQQILDQAGSQSLIQQKQQTELLRKIEVNTAKADAPGVFN